MVTSTGVTHPSIDTMKPPTPVVSSRLLDIATPSGSPPDFVQFAAFDQGDELVPLGMREPDDIGILANRDPVVTDDDLGALRAVGAQAKRFRFHRGDPS